MIFYNAKLFGIAMILYLVATVFYVTYVVSRNRSVGVAATLWALAGWLVNTAAIGVRWMESHKAGFGYVPLSNMYESMVFFAWSILLIYLVFEYLYGYKAIGVFASILGFVSIAVASMGNSDIQPLVPALQSNWLTAHVVTCFFGYAAFGVAYAVALLFLNRDENPVHLALVAFHPLGIPILLSLFVALGVLARPSTGVLVKTWLGAGGLSAVILAMHFLLKRADELLPPPKALDELCYKAVAVGFPLLTLGILTGAAWANYAWGTYWSWDPKETWSLITWFVYAAYLHARLTAGWKGRRLAWVSVGGFAAVIFTYWGVNFVLSGLHSYGRG
jgi:cytochrome c-type biogenesis protein CcsB